MKFFFIFCLCCTVLIFVPAAATSAQNVDETSGNTALPAEVEQNAALEENALSKENTLPEESVLPEGSGLSKESSGEAGIPEEFPPVEPFQLLSEPARQQQPPMRTVIPAGPDAPEKDLVPAVVIDSSPPRVKPAIKIIPKMPDFGTTKVYRIQLGSFSGMAFARDYFNRLKTAGFTPAYEQYGSLYRVVITGIQAADMANIVQRLEGAGFAEAWLREEY